MATKTIKNSAKSSNQNHNSLITMYLSVITIITKQLITNELKSENEVVVFISLISVFRTSCACLA